MSLLTTNFIVDGLLRRLMISVQEIYRGCWMCWYLYQQSPSPNLLRPHSHSLFFFLTYICLSLPSLPRSGSLRSSVIGYLPWFLFTTSSQTVISCVRAFFMQSAMGEARSTLDAQWSGGQVLYFCSQKKKYSLSFCLHRETISAYKLTIKFFYDTVLAVRYICNI